jgi:hypothetical protein
MCVSKLHEGKSVCISMLFEQASLIQESSAIDTNRDERLDSVRNGLRIDLRCGGKIQHFGKAAHSTEKK